MEPTAFAAPAHVSEPFYGDHLATLQHRATPPFDAPALGSGQLSGQLSTSFEQQQGAMGSYERQQQQLHHRPSFEQQQLLPGGLGGGTSDAPTLHTGFQPPQLSTGFASQPSTQRNSYDQVSPPPQGSFEQRHTPDLGYLGSPPRGLTPTDGGLSRAVGSPVPRSAVGSPVPQTGFPQRLPSPGRDSVGSPPARDAPTNGAFANSGMNGATESVESCKLVILGLPWDTSEETLQAYFAQYGILREAVIMKDRYTGKSRGFGFVTYLHADDASRVVTAEHNIDGRRCEAKLALPRGGANPNRTTRIFVARILPAVTEDAFRAHFEAFGTVQDAYMPKDASKLGHRGIGFVTFASADSVEKVMADTHVLCGQELAIDRATPKDRSPPPVAAGGRAGGGGNGGVASFGYGGSGNPYAMATGLGVSPAALSAAAGAAALRPGNDPNQLAAAMLAGGFDMDALLGASGLGGQGNNMQALQGLPELFGGDFAAGMAPPGMHYGMLPSQAPPPPHRGRSNHGSIDMARSSSPSREGERHVRRGSVEQGGRAMSPSQSGGNSALSHGGGGGGGSVTSGLDANAGPRIFVGKLNRATTEADVREYFTRFGYVLDVYMPRDKHNRHEHRGFGFVTFETEAAVQRVAAHGLHQIRGAAVAIDSAVPRREDTGPLQPLGDAGYPGLAAAMNIIDLAARGDAGPLRHLHAGGGNGMQRYRPYNPAGGPDALQGGY